MIGRKALGDFILVTGGTLQQAHRGNGAEHPGQFRHLRHVGLAEENCFVGVETAGQEIQRHVQRILPALGGIKQGGHRVIIGDEIESLAVVLQLDCGAHHAEIIAKVERAGGLDAG